MLNGEVLAEMSAHEGWSRYESVKVNSGVEAVVDQGIEMRLDEVGQYMPERVDESASETVAERLRRVNITDPASSDQTQIGRRLFGGDPGIRHDDFLGYYRKLYIGHVVNDEDRINSTSGGMATWILCRLLECGLIDGVIHMRHGRGGEHPLFEYGVSWTTEEVRLNAKTRYYPGEVSHVLNEVRHRNQGQRFALVGIPEVVAEVRLLGEVLPEFGELIPYTVGLLCAHQKTTKYVESMAWQLGIDPRSLEDADFRFKQEGSPADTYLTRITGRSRGRRVTRILDPHESLVANWGLGFFKSDFSDFTDDMFNETADVTLGDAWLPEYSSDFRGHNVVIVRNPVVAELLASGMASSKVILNDVDAEAVYRCQMGLIRHSHDEIGYRLWRLEKEGVPLPRTRSGVSKDIGLLRRVEQIQRMGNAVGSRDHYLRAELAGKFWKFQVYARWRVFIHRVLRVFELMEKKLGGRRRNGVDDTVPEDGLLPPGAADERREDHADPRPDAVLDDVADVGPAGELGNQVLGCLGADADDGADDAPHPSWHPSPDHAEEQGEWDERSDVRHDVPQLRRIDLGDPGRKVT